MLKELNQNKLDHNDFDAGQRGTWRKYNPYNPYIPEDENKDKSKDLKVESLDDLFEDDFPEIDTQKEKQVEQPQNKEIRLDELFDFEEPETEQKQEKKETVKPFSDDIQKELEAKFDELFGKIDN